MLYQKVRPKTWDEVAGNYSAIAILRSAKSMAVKKAYLLHGPSGTGKTTMALLLAQDHGCSDADIKTYSFNAATDKPDRLLNVIHDLACHLGLVSPKFIILDELDCLPERYQTQLLDVLDESSVSIILCTTKPEKITPSIKTRTVEVKIFPLTNEQMVGLLRAVCQREQIPEPSESIMGKIIRRAEGSPRAALTLLENTIDKTIEQAEIILADTIANQQEAKVRFEALGEMLGKTEAERFMLMMEWRLWECEGITAEQMFEKHFCRKRSAFYDWKKKYFKIDDTRSAAVSAGIRRKKALKSENQTSDTEQNQFDECQNIGVQHIENNGLDYRRNFSPKRLAEQCEAWQEQLMASINLLQEFDGPLTFSDNDIIQLDEKLTNLIDAAVRLGGCLPLPMTT